MPGYIIKICPECGKEFRPVNSRRKYCTDTHKNRFETRRWRALNPRKSVAAVQAYRLTNPHIPREVSLRYYAGNPEKVKERTTTYKRNNPEKHAAHMMVGAAIVLGILDRPDECSKCHRKCRPDAHHHCGYFEPLNVIWLCRRCHANIDRDL